MKRQYELKFNNNNSLVIYNGIDKDVISKYINKQKSVNEIINIGVVGRLEYEKGIDRLLEGISIISKRYSNFVVKIIGSGSQELIFKDYVKEKIEKYVEFYGFLSDPYTEMSKFDLLINVSRVEGFSLVIAEAMCLEIPVMSTKCSGPMELISDGKYGILIENSLDGIICGLEKVLNNKELLNKYRSKSIERSNFFNLKNVLEKTENLFDQ